MNYFAYERISTKEERDLQKYTRQEKAINRYLEFNDIELAADPYKDDCSGATFNRPAWKKLETMLRALKSDATLIIKDISRFTRERDNGYKKYKELMDLGVNIVILDNPTLSTDYIKELQGVAQTQDFITKDLMTYIVRLMLILELDRAEKEREQIRQRILDGIKASSNRPGPRPGLLTKMSDDLRADITEYLSNRDIKAAPIYRRYHISYNTFKKYVKLVREEQNQSRGA